MVDTLQDDSDGFNVICWFVLCLTLISDSFHYIRSQVEEVILIKQDSNEPILNARQIIIVFY